MPVEQMGDVEAVFGPSIARIIGLSAGCMITTTLGLLCFTPFYISWQQGGQIPTIAYLALLLGAPLLVVAISAFSCLFAKVRYRFFFCSEGIVHNLNGTVVSCRWDFIAEVKEEAFISSWLHPAYGLRYVIQMKYGREPLIVDVYVNRTAKFRRLMNEEVARRGIPWINVPDPFLHPVARKCPQCANTTFSRKKEVLGYSIHGPIERTLRQCDNCGTIYITPIWMRAWPVLVVVILGCFLGGIMPFLPRDIRDFLLSIAREIRLF
jgi:hypothetical protein